MPLFFHIIGLIGPISPGNFRRLHSSEAPGWGAPVELLELPGA